MHGDARRGYEPAAQDPHVRSAEERREAKAAIARVDASGKWASRATTTVEDLTTFKRAEDQHQKYLDRNPGGYSCHRDHKLSF